ncbi:hypothetical protein YPPY58_0171, partial [Yersinia pestis PY-58]
MRRLQSL